MRAAHRPPRAPHPSVRRASDSRKGRADENSNRPDDRYGSRRLRALYEIGKILNHYIGTMEEAIPPLLAILTRELPVRCAIFIEKISDRPRTIVWHDPGVSADDLKTAEARALKSLADLTRSAPPAGAPAGDPATNQANRGRFIMAPLIIAGSPIFGALRLEGAAPFDEEDVEFASAIAGQLAVALDRNQARLHQVALRHRAESMEQKVSALNADLERRVSQRTAELKGTLKELQALTYSLAHDLRAPLRHIHGFSQRLLAAASDEACKDHARRIMAASEGMDVLIKDLLSYSRLTLEDIELAPVSLASAMAQCKTAMEGELKERKAHLQIREPLPRVVGHEATLVQAISNLLSNALKFTAPGVAPRILVKAELRGNQVRLWVEDNGIGIAPEHQERIFGVFQRLNRAEDYPGTGIGLAFVRRALERMNGRAGVESQAGQGSRFWIELVNADGAR